jgi:MoaA/NifB/PqqE/SkfB family radical SAM enzyme/radical SAM superfamily enzyme YgiQ (UPF0313 family)
MRVAFLHPYKMADHFFVEVVETAAIADLVADGHDAEAADFLFEPTRGEAEQIEELRAAIRRERYDVVFLERPWSDALVEALEGDEGLHVVAWARPELVERGLVRVGLRGPSRAGARGIVDAIAKRRSFEAIPGAIWRDGEQVRTVDEARAPGDRGGLLRELGGADFAWERRRTLSRRAANERRVVVASNLGCAYRNVPNRSGVFDGVEMPASVSTAGCTFCDVEPYERMSEADAIALIVAQIRGVLRARPEVREIAIKDDYALRFLGALGDALRPVGLDGREILLSARADYLLQYRDAIEEGLAGRFPAPIGFYLIGFESFATSELERFHKGMTAPQIERVVELMRAWTERFPGRFRVTPTGGFILFTPWTSLEDLRENANAIRSLGFERFRGRALLSQLRLYPNLPLYWLAKRDGLLLDRFERPDDSDARRRGYEADHPWRFRDPKVAEIHRKLLDARDRPDAELFAIFEDALDDAAGVARGKRSRPERLVRAPRDLQGARDRGPATTQIVLNRACNQNCAFCNARGREIEAPRARAARAIRAMRAAAGQGVRSVVLTGAEPMLEWYLKELIRLGHQLGVQEIAVETNGTAVEPQGGAAALADAGLDRVVVALPAVDAARADAITRDPGGFERALAGARALRAAGVKVEIAVPLTTHNRGALAAIVERAAALFGAVDERLAIEGVIARWIPAAPSPSSVLSPREAAEELVAGVEAAARASVPLRIAAGGELPPCVFDDPERARPVLRLGEAIVQRDARNYARLAACEGCAMRGVCPGALRGTEERVAAVARPLGAAAEQAGLAPVGEERRRVLQEYRSVLFQQSPEGTLLERRIVRLNFHCNQACDFCFVSRELPAIEHEKIVAEIEAAAERGAILDLSGGEPTLNPRLPEYLALARDRGIERLELQTNAIRMADPVFAKELYDAGLREAFVSLHGVRPESSDRVTAAPGTFVKTVEGIRNLLDLGVGVHLNFVLCGFNIADLAEFPDFVVRELVRGKAARLGLNFSYVAASTDNVPRDRKLIPRFSDIAWALAAAHERAEALGLEMTGFDSKCGVPACYLPRAIRERHFARPIPREELARNGDGFVRAPACERCELGDRCYGVRATYAELHGVEELRPIVGGEVEAATRLAPTLIHRGSVWQAIGLAPSHALDARSAERLIDDRDWGVDEGSFARRVQPIDRELLQLRAGLRSLIKAERRTVAEAEATAEAYRAQGVLAAVYRGPAGQGGAPPRAIAFVATTREALDEALAIEPSLTAARDGRAALVLRMGALLGYPACCVRAFADAPDQDDPTHIARLSRRHVGPLPFELNWAAVTLRLFSHYPCAPDCAATASLARATLDAMHARAPAVAAAFERALRSVVLVQAADRFVALCGAQAEPDGYRYDDVLSPRSLGIDPGALDRPLVRAFELEIAARLAAGDRVRLRGTSLLFERAGAPVAEIRFAGEPPKLLDFTGAKGVRRLDVLRS